MLSAAAMATLRSCMVLLTQRTKFWRKGSVSGGFHTRQEIDPSQGQLTVSAHPPMIGLA